MKIKIKFNSPFPSEDNELLEYNIPHVSRYSDSELSISQQKIEEKKLEDIGEDEKYSYDNSAVVNFALYGKEYCRTFGCCTNKGHCDGSTCYSHCCPCYNNHFKCCLPAVINKPKNYCIIPVRKCPPQPYIPNKRMHVCRKTKKRKKMKEKIHSSEAIIEEPIEIREEFKVHIAQPMKRAPEKVDGETEIQVPYFCIGQSFATQTSIPIMNLRNRRATIKIDPPIPIGTTCLKVILKDAFDAVCSTTSKGKEVKILAPGCNTKKLCRCTDLYKQREQLYDSDSDQFDELGNIISKSKKTEKRVECSCVTEGCMGSCGFEQNYMRTSAVRQKRQRVEPCIPMCMFYNGAVEKY
ncbi:hypothetical protein HHI36_014735 [Cryptolaemus montrouzieri]|uniref:Uncharacterized protein n=1 Tax=Cryptolaemus montrouzieri TaxID=559131 RepID=A0ABD2N4Q6_9CUCU